MVFVKADASDGSGKFLASPGNLISAAPQFTAATTAISGAASSLKTAVSNAIASFDGDTHKNLQTLGDSCVKNLQDLANAMDGIATRLTNSGNSTTTTDKHIAHGFDPNTN
jgi:uncharacterized protein YukE